MAKSKRADWASQAGWQRKPASDGRWYGDYFKLYPNGMYGEVEPIIGWALYDGKGGTLLDAGHSDYMSDLDACDYAAARIAGTASRRRAQQYSDGWLTDARDHDGNSVDVGDVLVNINDGREYEVTEYDSNAVYTEYNGSDMQFASWYDVHLNWEKKAGRKMSRKPYRYSRKALRKSAMWVEINGIWTLDDGGGYTAEVWPRGALGDGPGWAVMVLDVAGNAVATDGDAKWSIDDAKDAAERMLADELAMASRKIAFNEYEFIPSEWKNLGRNDDDTCDVFWNGQLSVYRWDDGTWSVMEDLFDTLIWYESGATYADAIDNWIDQKEDGRFSLYAKRGSRKIASDGWDEDICGDVLDVLADCAELQYEISNCRRGAYVSRAGDTYKSLAEYAEELGENLIGAAQTLAYEYGDLDADEIDEMD